MIVANALSKRFWLLQYSLSFFVKILYDVKELNNYLAYFELFNAKELLNTLKRHSKYKKGPVFWN